MKRSSGVLMHVTSLWGDYSCGSFGTPAKEWIDFLAESKFTYWQTLPFCLPDEYNSPYKSFSAFSGNPFFIDLPTLETEHTPKSISVGKIHIANSGAELANISFACYFNR